MIRKLKRKFILLSMSSLFVLLAIIVAGMNVINYTAIVREADEILSLLSQNRGTFPDEGAPNDLSSPANPTPPKETGGQLPPHMSPELPYESRYFSVLMNEEGEVFFADISRITAVNEEAAIAYGQAAYQTGSERGFVGALRFMRSVEGKAGIRITFLDCGRRLAPFYTFLTASVLMALAGFVIVFFIIVFFSGRIIRPIAESYEKQKRFITDAGHEIKTPLTIIRANVDILEMELGENESLSDIGQQTKRLTTLTNDLISLARMEETEGSLQRIDFPLSEIVQEAAEPFHAPAQAGGKALCCDIQPMLSYRGNEKAMGQLVTILMDNAVKYTPRGGRITLQLARQNRTIRLTVCNTTEAPVDAETLDRLFDRFFRADPSRSTATGGHGIGLSIARSIVLAHGGRIAAATDEGPAFKITVILPT